MKPSEEFRLRGYSVQILPEYEDGVYRLWDLHPTPNLLIYSTSDRAKFRAKLKQLIKLHKEALNALERYVHVVDGDIGESGSLRAFKIFQEQEL